MNATHPPAPDVAADYVRLGYWRNLCGDDYLRRCVREFPDRVAVVDRERRATFKEVDALATRFAAAIAALGVGPGDVVSFQLPNWLEAVVVYRGIVKLGAIANPVVPIYRGRELRFILKQARSKVAVIPKTFRGFDFAEMYRGFRAELPDLDAVIVVGGAADGCIAYDTLMDGAAVPVADAGRPRAPEPHPDDIALLLYTSGTTADPKGALHSHNTLCYDAHYVGEWFQMNERDAIFNPSPVTHITGVLCALNIPFVLGCKVVLQDVWDADAALQLIEDERCTFMIFATPFLQGLTSSPGLAKHDVSSVRYIVCGGADIPLELMKDASARLGCVVRQYGATEAPSTTCTNLWDPFDKRATTDGRWMFPTQGRIVDEHGASVPAGAVGEVVWRGPDMFLGYLDPALNADAFTTAGEFRTGDLASMDADGYLTVRGRRKDIINRGGEKISAKEVEDLIYEHPAVQEAAVVAMPDPMLGEKGCAYVVLKPGASLTFEELARHLGAREIAKQKLPERLEIIPELPKTASGKVQKFVLRERIATRIARERGQGA